MAALQLAGRPLTCSPSSAPRPSRRPLAVRAAERSVGPNGSSGADSRSRAGGVDSSAGGVDNGAGAAVPLPSGALWFLNLHSRTTPTYGSNFVLQRPTVGGPGLVRSSRPPAPVRHAAPPPAMPPVVWHAPGSGAGLGLTLAGSSLGAGAVVVDTEYTVLPPGAPPPRQAPRLLPGAGGAAAGSIAPNTTCTGIVWQQSVEDEADGALPAARARRRRRSSGRHPRRTQMLRFTCNLCGEVNDCEVNPHAWDKGSVFARCEGCTAVHKLRDNLRIFHELAGPVFPPRNLRSSYLVQEILDKIQENNRN
ncbi:hypothetical protein ABPG75_007542 [Micractinium tetrahymenae]